MQTDRFIRAIRGVLEALLPEPDLFALHPGKVIASNGANSVDVELDNPKWPQLVKVPVRVFAPGAEVTLKTDARVLVAFEAGQRDKPVCVLWGDGGLEVLRAIADTINLEADTVNLGGTNGQAVGRVGDSVQVTIPPGAVLIPSPITPFFAPNPTPIPLDGTITAGSSVTKSE